MNKFTNLELELLDKKIEPFLKIAPAIHPACGWIKAIRHALKMPAVICAKKIKVSQQTFNSYEKSEMNGTITLNSLIKAADAMNCNVVYAIVPREKSLKEKIIKQAHKKAKEIVDKTHHSMKIENQAIENINLSIKTLEEELIKKQSTGFWNE